MSDTGHGAEIQIEHRSTEPLARQRVVCPSASAVTVFDGAGHRYCETTGNECTFSVSGVLGHHLVVAFDKDGREMARDRFRVDCASRIEDVNGRYSALLGQLFFTMSQDYLRSNNVVKIGNRVYRGFVTTSRDHIHGIKAMKYFEADIRNWIDAFCDHQREDGMVWDFLTNRDGYTKHFEWRFPPEFIKILENGRVLFARQPIMNDLEYMLILGIHEIWKTTGDDEWMKARLDSALSAMRYATTSRYTWSDKFRLIKRPFTIDLWDFQSEYDAALCGGDIFVADPENNNYGIMFGDNTGMIHASRLLADLLDRAGRIDEARECREVADGMQDRLDAIAWNGEHYTMFIPEDPEFERDFGVDPTQIVSLSNAYTLNRGISQEKARAIIRRYQRLREETEALGPGEWYTIYPPVERGFGRHRQWHYVNGGVSPMVAGELAHGAFERGFEEYGASIVDRVADLGRRYGEIPRVWRGETPRLPEGYRESFTTIDLRGFCNTDTLGTSDRGGIPWMNEGANDAREVPTGRRHFEEVEFDIAEATTNRGRVCIGVSLAAPYADMVTVPVGGKARSLYFLHTMGGGSIAGSLTIRLADGSEHRRNITRGTEIDRFLAPTGPDRRDLQDPSLKIAWRGANPVMPDVGLSIWGIDNPKPETIVESVTFHASPGGEKWMIFGVSLSSLPFFLMPHPLSRGIPAPWSCGAMVYALYEGLAGVYDEGRAMDRVRVAPRWAATDTTDVTVVAKYEASGGYVAYRFKQATSASPQTKGALEVTATGSATNRMYEILLPPDMQPESVRVDGKRVELDIRRIEDSRYVRVPVTGVRTATIEIV
jgi:hypothetical protein